MPPKIIKELVERFERNLPAYKSQGYKEYQLRQEFINPFFEALGWDVYNEEGAAPAYRDVIYEDSIKTSKGTKAPDYCFTLSGRRMFFIEAKKPFIDIKKDIHPTYQLRRYSWSAKLPLSILTNFEEFAVYESRKRPKKNDKASTERIMYLTYKDYIEKWDEIYNIFSKEAIIQGSFDRFIESAKKKRGTAEVDDEFLKEIEGWRDELAQNIALRNTDLTVHELNYAVQRTVDRILFLRMCEDRGVEPYGQLLSLLEKDNLYAALCKIYTKADEKYNSGIFHFKKEKGRATLPDSITLELTINDKVLKKIIKHIYYPDSPYEFSVLSPEILGNVYEQFLGKVIRLTPSHRAKVEEKPEIKKAGGVYYTPQYIVDYIVENTVGKLCKGRTPKQISKLRIVDPACGSGSFLLGAYTCLLNYYLDYYSKLKNPKQYKDKIYQGKNDDWYLTIKEKKCILLSNIYGVDIDEQAVEVTKLSLLLKVLEGESKDVLEKQQKLWRERALPDLGDNIKCGNSLISPDFLKGGLQTTLFDEEKMYRINVFDWDKNFGEILEGGGFDAVIGNPPYVRMEGFKEIKDYLKANYSSHDERSDLYAYFIERGHKLINNNGRFGMIISNKFLRAKYGEPLREFLSQNFSIDRIVDFAGLPVFPKATVRTIVLLTSYKRQGKRLTHYSPPLNIEIFNTLSSGSISVEQATKKNTYKISSRSLNKSGWSFVKPETKDLITKHSSKCQSLNEYCNGQIYRGVVSGLTEAFVIDERTRETIIDSNPKAREIIKPFLNGRDVRRYCLDSKNIFLIYTYHGVNIKDYPAIEHHLKPFQDRLEKRATKQEWYELQQPQYNFVKHMDGAKIIFPDIAKIPRFALDETGYYSSNTTYFIPRRDLYLLALLNSHLSYFYFKTTCAGLEGKAETYLRFFGQYLAGFPVRPIDFSNPKDKKMHDKMIKLVERMLDLNKKLSEAKTPTEKERLQRQIDPTDQQVDSLVYELYGLTDEEIRIVESG